MPDHQEDKVVDDESKSRQPLGVQTPTGEVEGGDEDREVVARSVQRRRQLGAPMVLDDVQEAQVFSQELPIDVLREYVGGVQGTGGLRGRELVHPQFLLDPQIGSRVVPDFSKPPPPTRTYSRGCICTHVEFHVYAHVFAEGYHAEAMGGAAAYPSEL